MKLLIAFIQAYYFTLIPLDHFPSQFIFYFYFLNNHNHNIDSCQYTLFSNIHLLNLTQNKFYVVNTHQIKTVMG